MTASVEILKIAHGMLSWVVLICIQFIYFSITRWCIQPQIVFFIRILTFEVFNEVHSFVFIVLHTKKEFKWMLIFEKPRGSISALGFMANVTHLSERR